MFLKRSVKVVLKSIVKLTTVGCTKLLRAEHVPYDIPTYTSMYNIQLPYDLMESSVQCRYNIIFAAFCELPTTKKLLSSFEMYDV